MINTDALEHCFDHSTQSYKFYWLMAILETIAQQQYHINIMDLSARMACMAWYPVLKHNVSLGKTDSFRPNLTDLQQRVGFPVEMTYYDVYSKLRLFMTSDNGWQSVASVLRQFVNDVPYCFLAPWSNLKGAGERIKKDFRKLGNIRIPGAPYSIARIGEDIFIDIECEWADYLFRNSWQLYEKSMSGLRSFVSRRNQGLFLPDVLLEWKIDPATVRQQVDYWNIAIAGATASGSSLRCLFTGQDIQVNAYRLDHFLPLGDVTSDRVWSIFPASLSASISISGYHEYCALRQFGLLAAEQQLALKSFLGAGGAIGMVANEFRDWNVPVQELVSMSTEAFTRAYEACLSGASFKHSNRSFQAPNSVVAADDCTRGFHLGYGSTYIENQYNR